MVLCLDWWVITIRPSSESYLLYSCPFAMWISQLSSRGRIYLPTLWIWVGLCLDLSRMVEVTLCDLYAWAKEALSYLLLPNRSFWITFWVEILRYIVWLSWVTTNILDHPFPEEISVSAVAWVTLGGMCRKLSNGPIMSK